MPAPDPALVAACEAAELDAFADILAAAPPALRETFGLMSARIAGALAIASHTLEKRMYNHVFSLGVSSPVTGADLDAIEAFFSRAHSPSCRISLAPGANGEGLAAALESRGFRPEAPWLRLCRDTSPCERPEAAYAVRELAPADGLAFGLLVTSTFAHPEAVAPWLAALAGRERWRVFGAFDADALVACGALHVSGDAGWLGLGATHQAHRGRGAQSALIAARLDAARAMGVRLLAVETTDDTPETPNPSTHNLRRLGFRDLYPRRNWVKVLRGN
jgi:GNAT superfamily N-acetyltransferase